MSSKVEIAPSEITDSSDFSKKITDYLRSGLDCPEVPESTDLWFDNSYIVKIKPLEIVRDFFSGFETSVLIQGKPEDKDSPLFYPRFTTNMVKLAIGKIIRTPKPKFTLGDNESGIDVARFPVYFDEEKSESLIVTIFGESVGENSRRVSQIEIASELFDTGELEDREIVNRLSHFTEASKQIMSTVKYMQPIK